MRERYCPVRKYAFFLARALGCTSIEHEKYDLTIKPRRLHRNPECRPSIYVQELLGKTSTDRPEPKNMIDFLERSPLYVVEQTHLYRSRVVGRCQQTNGRGGQLNIVTGYN
jgi:hypothetical protein